MFQNVFKKEKDDLAESSNSSETEKCRAPASGESDSASESGREDSGSVKSPPRMSSLLAPERTTNEKKPVIARVSNESSWSAKVTSQRQKNIDELVRSFAFYWGSLLGNPADLQGLLADPKDCVLCDILNTDESFTFHFRNAEKKLENRCIIYRRKTLMLADSTPFLEFIRSNNLNPVNRPLHVEVKNVEKAQSSRLVQTFPISALLLQAGLPKPIVLKCGLNGRFNAHELMINDFTEEEKDRFLYQVHDRKDFGNERIWRFIGVTPDPTRLSLYMEDVVYGSLLEAIRSNGEGLDPNTKLTPAMRKIQLHRYAIEMAEGLRYLEKYEFVHYRLSIDCFLLTYDTHVKLAIYGLSEGELFATRADVEEVDRCRWLPTECLPSAKNPRLYDRYAMMYTFGTVLWSAFHQGALPYENETADEIRSFTYREGNPLEVCDGLLPDGMNDIIAKCWTPSPISRPSFIEILQSLKDVKSF